MILQMHLKFIKQTINKLGFDLRRINRDSKLKYSNFDDLLKDKSIDPMIKEDILRDKRI